MDVRIALAVGDEEIRSCYPVMAELRPHVSAEEFLPRVRRQMEAAGYKLAYLADGEAECQSRPTTSASG